MATSKKTSKVNKSPLSLSKKVNKKQLGILIAAFAVIGVGAVYWYKSHAAAVPPANLTASHYVNGTYCKATSISTAYGAVAYNCFHPGNNNTTTIGNLGLVNKQYTATTGTLTPSYSQFSGVFCGNTGNYFAGLGPFNTAYGPVVYGYEYSLYGSWQARPSTYSPITRNCSTSGSWKPAIAW